MHSSYTVKNGAKRALLGFAFLLKHKRLAGFLAIPYLVVSPIYVYCFNVGFPFFPLIQAQFLLFHYVANIQASIQESIQEYTFFMFPEWLHYFWIPVICFLFNYVHVLFVNYAFQIVRSKVPGNIEKAFIVTNAALYSIFLWSMLSSFIVLPLGVLWSFTKQTTLLKEFILVCYPFLASFLTGPVFSLCILSCLFFYQCVTYTIIAKIALNNASLLTVIRHGCSMAYHMFFYIVGGSVALSFVWGCATWAFNPFLSAFVIPVIINAVALVFSVKIQCIFDQK